MSGSGSSAQLRPELAGVKVRKRKKDLKAKHEPEDFRDELLEVINPAFEQNGFEGLSKALDSLADSLEYKRYAEPMFDLLFTGALIATSGDVLDSNCELSKFCIFNAEETIESMKKHVEVFVLLTRRFRYLQVPLEESIRKMLRILHRWNPKQANLLAMCVSFMFSSHMVSVNILDVLFMDHLVKEGYSLQFVTVVFRTYLVEFSIEHLGASLKKSELENKLLDFFPPNKRSTEFFSRHFSAEGLDDIVKYYQKQQAIQIRNELKTNLKNMLSDGQSLAEVVNVVKAAMTKNSIAENDIVSLLWESIMDTIDWSRRPEQAEEQCLAQVKKWGPLLENFATNAKSQMALMLKVQAFCYENTIFSKIFMKIVRELYTCDAVSENCIQYWYSKGAAPKGKDTFLKQMQPFINWLSQADSDEE